MNRFIMASWWYRCWCVYVGCSPKLSSSSWRNSKLSRVIGLLLVLKKALMNMLVAEKPDAADEDDEVTSDDEVIAPSFWDASRNISPNQVYIKTKGSAAARRRRRRRRWERCGRRAVAQNTGVAVLL